MLPCAVEKIRELERREGAVTVLTVIEEPVVMDTVYAFVNRLDTARLDVMLIVFIVSKPPSSVETVSGLV